jgi:hypothetical protein
MQQGVRLEMDPDEWTALVALAARSKPAKGNEDEVAMSKLLQDKGQIITAARQIEVKQPF